MAKNKKSGAPLSADSAGLGAASKSKNNREHQSGSSKFGAYNALVLDLVIRFLEEHGYQAATERIKSESQKRAHGGDARGWKDPRKLPNLEQIFHEWQEDHEVDVQGLASVADKSVGSPAAQTGSDSESEGETSEGESDSSGSDGDSDAESESASDSNSGDSDDSSNSSEDSKAETEALPTLTPSATAGASIAKNNDAGTVPQSIKRKRSPSTSSSEASSESDSDDSQSTSEDEPNPKRAKRAGSSSKSSSSDSDSSGSLAPANVALPKSGSSSSESEESESGSSSESGAESDSDDDGEDSSKITSESASPAVKKESSSSRASDSKAKPGPSSVDESSSESESGSSASESSSGSSSGDSESESGSEKSAPTQSTKRVHRSTDDHKSSSDSSVTLAKASPEFRANAVNTVTGSVKRKRSASPEQAAPPNNGPKRLKNPAPRFSRVPENQEIDPRFASNAYQKYDYANRAYQDLSITKGKGFTKEKNKKKRGSYRGGIIDTTPKGIKFDD